MPAVARSRASDARQYTSWDRARLSVVVPIGVIVAVAIACVVVAVLSSAQRADVVAVDNERQMFSRALSNYGAYCGKRKASLPRMARSSTFASRSTTIGSISALARGWKPILITITSLFSIAITG